ncbi:MAG: sodium:proton antiporter NhaD [Gammaproteobacteria bacterium]|nr:sodium:proton antiporter NhaD [Gammaproteobacteria bacterium]
MAWSKKGLLLTLLTLLSGVANAAAELPALNLTTHWVGYLCLAIFVFAYALVIMEEHLHLRKSKPVVVAAGIIWALVAGVLVQSGDTHSAGQFVRHNLLEYGELFLFLLAAMTYINTMDERGVFRALRVWLVSRGFSLRQLFWITGILAFFISGVADNLTTALLMSAVVLTLAADNKKFIVVACINVVVAANAGGAFSPFGDITTLMVWQKGVLKFHEFFVLFLPSLVNWFVPAIIMSFTVGKEKPPAQNMNADVRKGAWTVVALFVLTIILAVCGHNFLHLPPVLGMMTGLGLLKFYGYYLKRCDMRIANDHYLGEKALSVPGQPASQFNIFQSMERVEWDTLMFFYGIILCVGGLGALGYLGVMSHMMYGQLGATQANILVGIISAVVDNIPVMFAVLTMLPDMSHGQWLLVTLTAGVGGSLLSIGSAAGVAVMGQARGTYTFFAHLKWTWAIALGYAASIACHFWLNAKYF